MRHLLTIILLAANLASAAHLNMDFTEDTMSAEGTDIPLSVFLQDIANAGVDVRMDPQLDTSITVNIDSLSSEKALKKIIAPLNYTVRWELMKTPLGKWPVLSSVHVFEPGKMALAKPLKKSGKIGTSSGGRKIKIKYIKDELLIKLKPGTTLAEFKALLKKLDATPTSSIPELGIYRLRLNNEGSALSALRALEGNPLVEHAEPNFIYDAPTTVSIKDSPSVALPPTPNGGVSANGIPVAVLDSGLAQGSAINDAVVASLNAPTPGNELNDLDGHGTQMAYLAAGHIAPVGMSSAMASEYTPIVAIRAFDDDGLASNYGIMQSMQFGIDNGARVFSLSWGSDYPSEFMADAVNYAHNNNAIVVAAAGNTPSGNPLYPAAYPNVLGVAATTPEGERWEDSNFGTFVDLSASGYAQVPSLTNPDESSMVAGTSVATAFAANTLSRYWAANPDLESKALVSNFLKSLTDTGAPGVDPYFGSGSLDESAIKGLFSP